MASLKESRLEEKPPMFAWKGENLEPIVITPARKRVIFNQNLLVQLLYLDNCPLFLALETVEKESDYKKLCSLLKESGYLRAGGDAAEALSMALDTLLDFGIFKAEWKRLDHIFKRIFINRNELFDMFGEFEEKLMRRISEENFVDTVKNLTGKIHLGEANEIDFEDCYYENRIEETEAKFLKFVDECLLKEKYDVLLPLARKGWTIFEHLKGSHERTYPCEYDVTPEIKNRRICVFDDAVKKGKQLYKALARLIAAGVPKENITLVTYLVNQSSYFHPENETRKKIIELLGKDILYYTALNDLEFRKEVSNILMYVAHFGSIIDADHLFVTIRLSRPLNGKDVMRELKNLKVGKVLEPGANLQYLYPTKKKITIDKVDYNAVTGDIFPESVVEKEQCKIRMIWDYDPQTFLTDRFALTPIINPVISCNGDCKRKDFLRFCDLFRFSPLDMAVRDDDRLCVDCTLYQMIPKLLEAFLKILATHLPTELHVTDIEWIEFEQRYRQSPIMQEWNEFTERLSKAYA
ncbi:MAG: hypothetical protein QXX08_05445 [Candidatus Bathyarchaeia archaeon]